MIVISIILIIIAGFAEAIMDTLAHHFESSVFSKLNPQFWNPIVSGANKWKDGKRENGEKFFLSSTLLVGVTEAWHLFKMIRTLLLFSSASLIGYALTGNIWVPISIMSLRVVYGIIFTIGYKYLKK